MPSRKNNSSFAIKKAHIIGAIAAAAAITIAIAGYFLWLGNRSNLDDFAKCLNQRGMKFYGAFWCSHCQSQKSLFGGSKKYLPYVECSTADGKDQLEVCREAKIDAYPTWEFADGSRKVGELTLRELSNKSGCQLPKQELQI